MPSIYLPGKFARFTAGGVSVAGAYEWGLTARRDRLDTTNFESAVSANGINVCSDGLTGVLDTTFNVSGYASAALINILYPAAELACTLLFRKNTPLGYYISYADVLSFAPKTSVRDKGGFSAELQSSGIVGPAV